MKKKSRIRKSLKVSPLDPIKFCQKIAFVCIGTVSTWPLYSLSFISEVCFVLVLQKSVLKRMAISISATALLQGEKRAKKDGHLDLCNSIAPRLGPKPDTVSRQVEPGCLCDTWSSGGG